MAKPARAGDTTTHADWERAWSEQYGLPVDGGAAPRRLPRLKGLRDLLLATCVLGVAVTSAAVAGEGADVNAARGEGAPVLLGERNPGSGESTRETAMVANAGNGGLVLRPSNTAKGGRAISATCDNDGTTDEDGCAVYVNKGQGAAATFRTQGSVPFAIRSTNNGVVQHLNADRVDGKSAADFLGRSERAADSALLAGNPPSAFLGASAKAVDSDTLDGQDSSAFLGATAKAADAETVDGQDSSAFLGATAKAADSETLDGYNSLSIARFGGGVFSDGDPTNIGYTSSRSALGVYRVDFPAGSFKTSNSCKPPTPIAVSRSNTAVIVTIEDGSATCNAGDGSGGFGIRTFNAAGAAIDANIWFILL
jgi:hypothetical protein